MTTVSSSELLTRLAELLKLVAAGETVVIADDDHAIAQLVPPDPPKENDGNLRGMGSMKGSVLYMAEDFDDPLPEFEEYM